MSTRQWDIQLNEGQFELVNPDRLSAGATADRRGIYATVWLYAFGRDITWWVADEPFHLF